MERGRGREGVEEGDRIGDVMLVERENENKW